MPRTSVNWLRHEWRRRCFGIFSAGASPRSDAQGGFPIARAGVVPIAVAQAGAVAEARTVPDPAALTVATAFDRYCRDL